MKDLDIKHHKQLNLLLSVVVRRWYMEFWSRWLLNHPHHLYNVVKIQISYKLSLTPFEKCILEIHLLGRCINCFFLRYVPDHIICPVKYTKWIFLHLPSYDVHSYLLSLLVLKLWTKLNDKSKSILICPLLTFQWLYKAYNITSMGSFSHFKRLE